VDVATDPANCGSCLHACSLANEVCAAGTCACPAALPDPCLAACVNLQTDPQNCQVCGRVCPLTNDVCVSGACQCPVGLPDVCAQTCVDKQTDPQNCGTLCSHCATGAMCNAGQCACPAGEDVCGSGTSAACTDRQTDEQNCGTCGNRCATGASCAAGSCACPTSIPVACGGNAGQCCAGNGCCAGSACQTVHANGLGQSYYDCGSLNQHTPAQAQLAAQAWDPTATLLLAPTCGDPNCLCAQGSAKAAIWCYFGSQLDRVGRVLMTPSPNCAAAVCPSTAYGSNWN
jgi:hypothetical protein